jgi:hypothetical protein
MRRNAFVRYPLLYSCLSVAVAWTLPACGGGDDPEVADAAPVETFDAASPDAQPQGCVRTNYKVVDVTGTITTTDTVGGDSVLNLQGENLIGPYTMPWSFPLYGQAYTDITVDSNSNIWMAAGANYESQFDLAAGGAQALPVVSIWNESLTADDYGDGLDIGVFTAPDRVLFEFETEALDSSGSYNLTDFSATLFPNGYILLSYDSFDIPTCADAGSGVSKANGTDFLNITSEIGKVCAMDGKRYLLEPACASDDADDDGLGDALETTLGTMADNPDSDGDGLLDGWEHFITGTDPLVAES